MILLSVSSTKCDKWDNHLFHRNASMLEGIGVVADVMVVIIGIGKEIPTCGEDIACTHVGWGRCISEGRG